MKARPVYEEPHVDMQAWGVVISSAGTAHIGGMHQGTRLRLSTAVETFDLASMTATTASGRTYRLGGIRNDALALAAVAVFRGPLEAEGARPVSPEELELMLSPMANRWGA
mgnify:CR=1 FL=1